LNIQKIFASDILLAIAAIIISSIAVDFHVKLNFLKLGTDAYAAAAVNI
jgi:hypothetical protein